jgi:hypothetical protein
MTYGELKDKFERLLARSDITDTLTEDFLEMSLNRVARSLRIPSMEYLSTLTTEEDGSVGIPSDFLKMKHIWVGTVGDPVGDRLEYTSLEVWQNAATGTTPLIYTRIVDRFYIKPVPAEGTTVTVWYWRDFPSFTADTDEHVMFLTSGDMIVYGALSYAADHFQDNRRDYFEARFNQLLVEAQTMADEMEMEEGTLAITSVYDTSEF